MEPRNKAKLLRSAASALEHGRYATAKKKIAEAIGTDIDGMHRHLNERHPDTDIHRAGCPSCQMAYDKALPDPGTPSNGSGRKWKMTQERMAEIADQLTSKAESVDDGFYGEDDDNDSWAADLRRAAKRLRRGAIEELCPTDREEIEYCADVTEEEMAELKQAVQS